MKKRIPRKQVVGKTPKDRKAKTGEHCPLTGWWAMYLTASDVSGRFVTEGNIMPAAEGRSVTWILIASESGPRPPRHALPIVGASVGNH